MYSSPCFLGLLKFETPPLKGLKMVVFFNARVGSATTRRLDRRLRMAMLRSAWKRWGPVTVNLWITRFTFFGESTTNLPRKWFSLKQTSPWKSMIGRWNYLFGMAYFQSSVVSCYFHGVFVTFVGSFICQCYWEGSTSQPLFFRDPGSLENGFMEPK